MLGGGCLRAEFHDGYDMTWVYACMRIVLV